MKKILLGFAIVAAIVLGAVLLKDNGVQNTNVQTEQVSQSIRIVAGTTNISVPATGGTLLDLMQSAKTEGKLVLEGKEYEGLGFFASKVGSLQGTNKQFLMYSINGTEASVGISGYVPKGGDVITWELKESY